MEDVMQEDTDGKAEDTDDLLCADVDDEVVGDFALSPPAFPRDHCDVLLDAIDAELNNLQTRRHGKVNTETCKTAEVLDSACLDRSKSGSKDTGLGSTKVTSTPDGSNAGPPDTSTAEVTRDKMETDRQQEEEVGEGHGGSHTDSSRQTGGARVSGGSRSEQCLWRLEQLLGSGTKVMVKDNDEEDDSVRTEDFSAKFQSQMLELPDLAADRRDSASASSDTGVLTESQLISTHNTTLMPTKPSLKTPIRHLAGVPVRSFDSVTIDSDLDSVCTERVRQHLQSTKHNRTVQQMFMQKGSQTGRHTHHPKVRPLSSDDEGLAGGVNGEFVRCYRGLRAPSSVQRREKRNRNRRSNSTTHPTPTTTSKRWQNDKLGTEFIDIKLPLVDLQEKKVAVQQVLKRLREEVEQAERERHTLQISVTHTRAHTQLLRTELHKLQAQRDSCVKEVRALQESQAALQRHTVACSHDASSHRASRHDASPHNTTHHHDTSIPRCVSSSCVSVLEREEMDRLLDSTKAELFSEQRRFRRSLDSLQERLEEVTQEMELKEEDNRKLREENSQLEEKLTAAIKHREELQRSVAGEQVEQEGRLGALEKIVAQKELLLLGLVEEKTSLELELKTTREEHGAKLTAALAQAQEEKEEEVERLRSRLRLTHEHERQQICHQAHEAKAAALREQALTHTRNAESLHNCIKLKEQEVKSLQVSLVHLQGALRKREEELKRETQEQVKRVVEREQRRWEEQRAESLREQHGMLEEQMKEVERERRRSTMLQSRVVELQARVEELETGASAQTDLLRTVRDEHQAEMQKLRRQLQQEAETEAERLKQSLTQSEQQLQNLQAVLAERERVQQEAAVRQEQQNRSWAQDIHTESVNLQELLTHNGLTLDTKDLSHSTVSEAVRELQTVRRPLQQLITILQNHITLLTNKTQQLTTDKESELRVQREQLTAEKERALNSLKDKFIQEHIEELSRVRLREDDDGGGSVAASLRRQLQAKDEELRQVQRNMAEWKEKTTARLARKFEEELTSELERRGPGPESELQRRVKELEGEMRHLKGSCGVHPASESSTSLADLTVTPSSHDVASYKLICHLQNRIRHLQAEKHKHTPSSAHVSWHLKAGDLAGSYLETIPPLQDSCVPRHHSTMRKALS